MNQNLQLSLLDSGETVSVRDFVVDEAASSPFLIRLVARASQLSLEEHIGERARFSIAFGEAGMAALADAEPLSWTGHIAAIEDIGGASEGSRYFRVELVSSLWLLSQNRNHRVFERTDEVSIVCQLLDEWGLPHMEEVDPAIRRGRKLIVQYGESDLDFIHRLLEAVGVTYLLEDVEGVETVVLTDAPHLRELDAELPFVDNPPHNAVPPHVTSVRVERKLRAGRYAMQSLDHRRRSADSLSVVAEVEGASVLERSLERFHYRPGFADAITERVETVVADDRGAVRVDEAFGESIVQRRIEAKTVERLRVTFESNELRLQPGMVLRILDHSRPELATPLLLASTQMSGSDLGDWRIRVHAYSTRFSYRPPLRTRRPEARGLESVTVVGPSGSEIHTDEFGRVRVQFHWDRVGDYDERSSCWIPVSQAWAGAGYGSVLLPRVGQEVLVQFLGGDPDLPVVIGRVYTALERVPYKLPDEASVSVVVKTQSLGGGDGYNEIKADDRAGAELVSIRAERDLETLVRHHERHTVLVNRTVRVGNDEVRDVARHVTETIGGTERRGFTSPQPNAPKTETTTQNGFHHAKVGSSEVTLLPGEMTLTSPIITLGTGAGASIKLEGSKITISAATIDIHGGVVDVQGTPIKLNCT